LIEHGDAILHSLDKHVHTCKKAYNLHMMVKEGVLAACVLINRVRQSDKRQSPHPALPLAASVAAEEHEHGMKP
jgi:hypothetical protein